MRFDVHELASNPPGYAVDVQAELLSHLPTRVVIPLRPEKSGGRPVEDLHPVFEIMGERFVLMTHALASVPKRELKRSIASLNDHHDEIARALDILLTGF
jgi:toxin CcdB